MSTIYDALSREELIQELIKRDGELSSLKMKQSEFAASTESQITEIMNRFGDLKKMYDEQSNSLISILWLHCTKNNPDVVNIPVLDTDNMIEAIGHVGDYIFGEFLGEGTFATVKSCRKFDIHEDKDEKTPKVYNFAVKIIDKHKIKTFASLKRLSDEIGVLKRLSSPYITTFHDCIHTRHHLYIITDRGGNDMFDFLHHNSGAVNVELARQIMLGILSAVNYLHEQGCCHRDLKPENVLLSFPYGNVFSGNTSPDGPTAMDSSQYHNPATSSAPSPLVSVKICDFGVSSKFHKKFMLQDFVGSPGFFAPEMLLQGCYFGDKVDLWSIGCILLEMALGHRRFCLYWMRAYSFDIIQDNKLFHRRITDTVTSVLSPDMLRIDTEYEDFLVQFLQLKPSNRPSFKKISQHSWLRGLFVPLPSSAPGSANSHSRPPLANSNAASNTCSENSLPPTGQLLRGSSVNDDCEIVPVDNEMTALDGGMRNDQDYNGQDILHGSAPHDEHSSLLMELYDNLSQLVHGANGGFGSGLVSSNLETPNNNQSSHNHNRMSHPGVSLDQSFDRHSTCDMSDDNETDTFRLPPSVNWKSLLPNIASTSNSLHPTMHAAEHEDFLAIPFTTGPISSRRGAGSEIGTANNSSGINSPTIQQQQQQQQQATIFPNRVGGGVDHQSLGHALSKVSSGNNSVIGEKHKVRVLLVEDSAFQRKLMARRIQSVGLVSNGQWEVVQCEDGEKACTVVDESVDAKEKFDVVVVDQTLSNDSSKMEGHEVVQYIRSKFKDAVIIGCTANVPKHSKSLLAGGADLVWAKPLPKEDVIFANVDSMMKIRRPQLSSEQVMRLRQQGIAGNKRR